MGCICSTSIHEDDYVVPSVKHIEKGASRVFVRVISSLPKEPVKARVVIPKSDGSNHLRSKTTIGVDMNPAFIEDNRNISIIEGPESGHQRRSTMDFGVVNGTQRVSKIASMPRGAKGEQVAAGWPSWLASVAGEAIQGLVPRNADSYEKLCKIGQGTYSNVYRARDLKTDRIVALKKVQFVNMDQESVRFMAREISILRKLDHPNVMKLEALVMSRISGSLYLVFEYMEHDLAGLLASPKIKFTESQIKCYMQQMFRGLEHCHSRGILHRDIKGLNLLVDNKGILKIGDFGLATSFGPDQRQPLTSRVVTLWYRAPELLLGASDYGVAIDMWSAGCILAELFYGNPIMPGRTEVEQMHKIFKLCGSPTEEYWRTTNLPHTGSFKSQRVYKRRVSDMFKDFPSSALDLVEVLLSMDPQRRGTASSALKSEFFRSNPLPCDPSSLPKYRPSKELEVKIREEESRLQKAERQVEYEKSIPERQEQSRKRTSVTYKPLVDSRTGFPIELTSVNSKKGYSHSKTVMHPNAARVKADGSHSVLPRTFSTSQHGSELARQGSQLRSSVIGSSSNRPSNAEQMSNHYSIGYVPKRSWILCSGPLMPSAGNMEDMLKEHEKQIQEVVRKSRMTKK